MVDNDLFVITHRVDNHRLSIQFYSFLKKTIKIEKSFYSIYLYSTNLYPLILTMSVVYPINSKKSSILGPFKHSKTQEFYVTKSFTSNNSYQKEKNALQLLEHPNIIKLVESDLCPHHLQLQTNNINLVYYQGGDLFTWSDSNLVFEEKHARTIFRQILNALIFSKNKTFYHNGAKCHGIFHCDLKPENIMMNHGIPYIIDWGLAYYKSSHRKNYYTLSGTDSYRSPQKIWNPIYDHEKNDVWSLGIILFNFLIKLSPYKIKVSGTNFEPDHWLKLILTKQWNHFWYYMIDNIVLQKLKIQSPAKDVNILIKYINNGHINKPVFLQDYKCLFNQFFRNLIQNMLNPDENERFSFEEVSNHPWFKGEFSSTSELIRLEKLIKIQCLKR